jgi:PAS domain-containing protein
MSNPSVEMILMRQLASHLAMPIMIVDPNGDLLYFNEAAEPIVGKRFDETGPIRRGEWTKMFKPVDETGAPLRRENQPLFLATQELRPSHQSSWIEGLDGVRRHIEGIAFPLVGSGDRLIGAAGIFWETGKKR